MRARNEPGETGQRSAPGPADCKKDIDMDWNQTKSIADANVDAITGKVSSPRAALSALEKKITGEVEKIEAYLVSLDGRAMELPGLLDQADQKVAKIQAVVAKAENDARADLKAAAMGRLAKEEGDRKALQDELDGLDNVQTTADEWLTKLQDKLMEVQAKSNLLPPDPKPAAQAAPAPAPAPAAKASAPAAKASAPAAKAPAPAESDPADGPDLADLDALVAAPKKAAPVAAPAPAKAAPAAKAGGKKDALDDEFAALFADLNVDLSQVELPNKKKAPAKIEVDEKIPDLVAVRDDELPDGEELPPLEMPKKGAPPPKGAAAAPVRGGAAAPAPKAAAQAPVKGGAAAPAAAKAAPAPAVKASAPPAEPAKASSKAWLWWTAGIVTLGGAGAAALHFVWGVF